MKKKALVLASCVAFATPTISIAQALPNNSVGLNLGDINATSYLNQPFRGVIPFLFTNVESARQLSVRLAPQHVFDQIGAEKLPILNNLQFQITSQSNKPVIQISSHSPIQLPFLNFVLEIEGPEGVLYQDYTVLLDPQGYQSETQLVQEEPTLFEISDNSVESVNLTNDSVITNVNNVDYLTNETTISNNDLPVTYSSTSVVTNKANNHRIKSGDSLSRIAKQYKPNDISLNNMMRAIFDKNPKAFIRGDINKIKRGVVLNLPTHKELTGLNNIAKKVEFKGKTPKVTELTLSKNKYKVVKGDSLSKITQKFVDKDTSFTKMMNAIFTANPEAFSQNNKSQLKAGAILSIPSFEQIETATAKDTPDTTVKTETPSVTTVAISSETSSVKTDKVNSAETAKTANTEINSPEVNNKQETNIKNSQDNTQLAVNTSDQNSTNIQNTSLEDKILQDKVLQENEYRVKEGDTLTTITKEIGYENVSFTKMMKAIYTENMQAFEQNNITKLKVGSVLVLPERSAIEGITAKVTSSSNEALKPQDLTDNSVSSPEVKSPPVQANEVTNSNVISLPTKLNNKTADSKEAITENTESTVSALTQPAAVNLDTSDLEKRIRELRSELDQAQSGLAKMETELSSKDAIIFDKDTQLVDLKSSLIKLKISNESNLEALQSQGLAPEDVIIEDELYSEAITATTAVEQAALNTFEQPSIIESEEGFNHMLSSFIRDYTEKTSPKNLAYLSMALILGWLLIRYRREIYSYTAINFDEPKYYPAPGIDEYELKERNISHHEPIQEIDPIKEYVEDIEDNSIAELYSDPVQEFSEEVEFEAIESAAIESTAPEEESVTKETKEIEHCEHLVTELFSDLNSSSSSKTEVSIGENEWLSIEKICDDYIESKTEAKTENEEVNEAEAKNLNEPKVTELKVKKANTSGEHDVIDFKDAKPSPESDVTDFDEMMSDLLKSLDGVEKSINFNSSLKRKVKNLKSDPTEKST